MCKSSIKLFVIVWIHGMCVSFSVCVPQFSCISICIYLTVVCIILYACSLIACLLAFVAVALPPPPLHSFLLALQNANSHMQYTAIQAQAHKYAHRGARWLLCWIFHFSLLRCVCFSVSKCNVRALIYVSNVLSPL